MEIVEKYLLCCEQLSIPPEFGSRNRVRGSADRAVDYQQDLEIENK
jgi:hypothetical protein